MKEEDKEKVIISLSRYESLKRKAEEGSLSEEEADEIRNHMKRASQELGQFFNHLGKRIENFDDFVETFNKASTDSKILYSDTKERYYIDLHKQNEEEDNEQ